jgi:hypothetical protein
LRNTLISTLRSLESKKTSSKGTPDIPQEFAYMYPTINKMAAAILAQRDPTLESAPAISQVDAIRAMIEQYSIDMPTVTLGQKVAQDTIGATVVITGTTGGLGSDILLKLLHDDAIEHIYALNRSSSSATIEARQSAAFRTRY